MKAAELLVRCLENEGVQYIFGLPGEENLDLMDALSRSDSIRFITVRHEQGASFMASVYGRLSSYPGVCLATLGPGATNLATGIADAQLDRAPLVAITGQAELARTFKESHQYMDVVRLMEPITRWNTRVVRPESIPEIVRKAFRLARLEKPGATHIELPEDVVRLDVDIEPMPVRRTTYPAARSETIVRAADRIRAAQKPLVLAGNGVIRRQASTALQDFAHHLGIPVATTFMGKGVLTWRDPLGLPAMGLRSPNTPLGPLAECDLLITVGFDIVEWEPHIWNANPHADIIHIDSTAVEIDTDYRPVVEVIGEIGDSLRALSSTIGPRQATEMFARHRLSRLQELKDHAEDDAFPIVPQRFINDLRQAMGDEDIVISDVGAHKLWIAGLYPAARPNTVIIANGLAGMGIALPGAIGAKLARPERKVVAVSGDGGFLMNFQELETAKRLGIAMVAVVLVDNQYGVIALNQKRHFGETFAIDFTNPDFVALGNAFGIPSFAVESADDLLPTLRKALEVDGPTLVAVPFDNSKPPVSLA